MTQPPYQGIREMRQEKDTFLGGKEGSHARNPEWEEPPIVGDNASLVRDQLNIIKEASIILTNIESRDTMSEDCIGTIATRLTHRGDRLYSSEYRIGRNDKSSTNDWLHKIIRKNMGYVKFWGKINQ